MPFGHSYEVYKLLKYHVHSRDSFQWNNNIVQFYTIYLLMWILIIYYIANIIDIEAKARKGYHSSKRINIY